MTDVFLRKIWDFPLIWFLSRQNTHRCRPLKEYFNPITNGLVEYDNAIDEALKKLDEAGIDKFLEEYQRQFNEFYESKNK